VAAPEDPRSSIEGLRAWLAQLDRNLGVRTYILGALAVVSLAASAVAIVLVLQLKRDAATKDDVSALSDQVTGVQQTAADAAKGEVQSLDGRLSKLETELESVTAEQADLKSQIESLQQAASATGTTGVTGPSGFTGSTTGGTTSGGGKTGAQPGSGGGAAGGGETGAQPSNGGTSSGGTSG